LFSKLSVEDISELLLFFLVHGGLFPPILIELLFLILDDLDPFILRHLTWERFGFSWLNTLVAKFKSQVCKMLVVLGERFWLLSLSFLMD
jgi:hypothetical protein